MQEATLHQVIGEDRSCTHEKIAILASQQGLGQLSAETSPWQPACPSYPKAVA
jgi:hypothetical protein